MVKVCVLSEHKSGVDYHRIEVPFANMAMDYNDIEFTRSNGFHLDHLPDKYDAIVLNRKSSQPEGYLQRAKENGVKIILDLDDYWYLPKWHGYYDLPDREVIESLVIENIHLADEIWVASDYLGQQIQKEFGRNYIYIPNAIDFSQPQFIPNEKVRTHEGFTIGYIGAANHYMDLEKLIMPLYKLRKSKYKDDYKILLGGYNSQSKHYWDDIERIFTTNGTLPKSQYIRVPSQDVYNYAFMYNMLDVALVPLIDDMFSRCKSNLKVLEAACFSLPVICSNVEPYREFIEQGLVYDATGGWEQAISYRIKRKKEPHIGHDLHHYVKENYNIQRINKLRYESIMETVCTGIY